MGSLGIRDNIYLHCIECTTCVLCDCLCHYICLNCWEENCCEWCICLYSEPCVNCTDLFCFEDEEL